LSNQHEKTQGRKIWQESFYDEIIRNEAAYLEIWKYIDENPTKWVEDKYYCKFKGNMQ
jgi:REP element-mobilizing transposase RayT